jgi:hypothetical protein
VLLGRDAQDYSSESGPWNVCRSVGSRSDLLICSASTEEISHSIKILYQVSSMLCMRNVALCRRYYSARKFDLPLAPTLWEAKGVKPPAQ